MTVKCAVCGTLFRATTQRRRYCSAECAKFAEKELSRKRRKKYTAALKKKEGKVYYGKGPTIAEVLAYAEQNKERFGRYLSYGKAVAKMEQEKRCKGRKG